MKKNLCTMLTSLVMTSVLVTSASASTGPITNPKPSNAGDSYAWKRVNTGAGGGYIPATIFNKSEKDLVYLRTDMGGAYRWNPTDKTWKPLTDWVGAKNYEQLGIESIATDPVDTNRVYMAVGTYTYSWGQKGSILRSTDKGETWQETKLPFSLGGNMSGRCAGERLSIDPNDNSIIYLGARNGNGLWKSTDYGVTWNKVESFTHPGDVADKYDSDRTGVCWIAFDKSTGSAGKATQTIYVGVANTEASIYKSTDGGQTWEAVAGQPTKANQSGWDAAFVPQHGVLSSNGNLYVSYSELPGPYESSDGDVWRYNTKTGEWKNVSPDGYNSSNKDMYFGYGGIDVDAQNPDTIVVASLSSWWPDARMYRSTDGGETWKPLWEISYWPTTKRINHYTQDVSNAPWLDFGNKDTESETAVKLGWMVGGVSIDPFNSDKMYYGTGATLYGTEDLTNWDKGTNVNIKCMAQGIEETAVEALISPTEGAPLISGMRDVYGFVHKDLSKAPDKQCKVPEGNTFGLDYAQNKPSHIVKVSTATNASGFAYSTDGGENWTSGKDPIGVTVDKDNPGRVAISADGSIVTWAVNSKDIKTAFYSIDNGNTWTASEGLPSGASVIADRVNSKKFYGLSDGNFYVSTDGAKTFTKTASGLPKVSGTQGQFKAALGKEGDVWVVGKEESDQHGMWHSIDGGQTFTKISDIEYGTSIGFGKAKEGSDYPAIYTRSIIDGNDGFYRSDDAGKTWIRINDDAHLFGTCHADITGDPRVYGRVYIATNGLGIAYGDINSTSKVLSGDVNNDGVVNLMDYVSLKLYLSHKYTGEFNEANSDLDGDGKINVKDLLALRLLV